MSFRVDVSPYSMVDRSTTNKDLQHPKTRSFNKFTRSELRGMTFPSRAWERGNGNDLDSGHLGVLSRLGRRAGGRRRGGRRCAGGAIHPQKARRGLSTARGRLLLERGRPAARGAGLRRLLRQAAAQVRAAAGDLSGFRASWLSIVPDGHADLAQEKVA